MGLKKLTMILTALSVLATGCNEISPTGEGSNNSNAVKEVDLSDIDMDSLDKDLDQMELSMADVEKEMAKIDIAYLAAGGSGGTQNALDKELRVLFTKLYSAIETIYTKSGTLRALIEEKLAKLDASNPIHAVAIKKLEEYLKYLDDLQPKLATLITKLTGKITTLLSTVDGKIAQLDPNSPLTWAVQFVWLQVKNVFIEFRDKLIDLAT